MKAADEKLVELRKHYDIKNTFDKNTDEYKKAKLVLNKFIGMFEMNYESGYKTAPYAHLAAVIKWRANIKMFNLINKIGEENIIQVIVDGIIHKGNAVGSKEKQLGNLSSLINSSINKIIDINNNKINNLKLRLSILDINNLLNKGYSLVYKGNKLIKDISSLSLDDEIIIKTGNGKIVARIIDLKKE